MIKKLTKGDDGLVLEIDKPTADALGITSATNVELIIVDDMLIVKPKSKKPHSDEERKDRLKELTHRLMDQYEPVLKKLAKT